MEPSWEPIQSVPVEPVTETEPPVWLNVALPEVATLRLFVLLHVPLEMAAVPLPLALNPM